MRLQRRRIHAGGGLGSNALRFSIEQLAGQHPPPLFLPFPFRKPVSAHALTSSALFDNFEFQVNAAFTAMSMQTAQARTRKLRKTSKMVAVVVLLFATFWLPIHVFQVGIGIHCFCLLIQGPKPLHRKVHDLFNSSFRL